MSCLWCHNPESMSAEPEVRVLEARCIHCGSCGPACPRGLAGGPFLPDQAACLRCGRCAEACPTGARQLVGRRLTVAEVLDTIERDRPFYDESGGGVTFSGGEPLRQPRFLIACLEAARSQEIHTVVDTCGLASRQVLLRVASATDLFLYDLKVVDSDRHLRFTGAPLGPILENLRALDEAGSQVWLRMPLIPGYNDDRASLQALATVVTSLRRIRRLHLLPYHRLGSEKHARLGREYPMADVAPPAPENVEEAAAFIRAFGLEVHIGG